MHQVSGQIQLVYSCLVKTHWKMVGGGGGQRGLDVSTQTECGQAAFEVLCSKAHQQNTLKRRKPGFGLTKNYNSKAPIKCRIYYILHEAIPAISYKHTQIQRVCFCRLLFTCLVMIRYFWKSLGPSRSSRVKRVTLTSGNLDLTSSEQKRSRTPATPLPLSWGATRSPSTSMVSPSSITHTDSRAICRASWRKKDKENYHTDIVVFRTVHHS